MQRSWKVWIAVLVFLCFLLPSFAAVWPAIRLTLNGSDDEAIRASRSLREKFAAGYDGSVLLVVSGLRGGGSPLGAVLDHVLKTVEEDPAVVRTVSYRNTQDTLFLGRNGKGFLIVVELKSDIAPAEKDAVVARLREKTGELTRELAISEPRMQMRWTGEVPLDIDLWRIASQEARQAEARILPLVLIVLIVTFRSVAAAAIPISVGLISVLLTLAGAEFLSQWLPLSGVLANVVTMMGLGLGVDYSLLMVTRFREELKKGQGARAAARHLASSAGRTVLLSATTVAMGFAILLVVPNKDMRSIALGGIVVLSVASILAAKLLLVLLAGIGSKIDALSLPSLRRWMRAPGVVRFWSTTIFARPLAVLLLGILPLLFLALQGLRLEVRLPRGDWLPAAAESVQATKDLVALGRIGVFQALEVVVTLPPDAGLNDGKGWRRIVDLSRSLKEDSRVLSVRSVAATADGVRSEGNLSSLPLDLVDFFVSKDRATTLLLVIPKAGLDLAELGGLVSDIRSRYGSALRTVGGSMEVGGVIAQSVDDNGVVKHRLPIVLFSMLLATFVILTLGLRSPLLALKASILNALSVGAAFGALVLVFQDGHGGALMGLQGPTGGIFPNIPILAFCVVFGLSMDYEIFLFSRVREYHLRGMEDSACMALALESTAGVLVSAAVVMIIVFMGFCFGNFLLIKMLGFVLSAAVAIDVTLVRLVIGPALFALAGRWNWWPGE